MMSLPDWIFLKFRMDRLMWCVYFELCFAASSPVLPLENKLPATISTIPAGLIPCCTLQLLPPSGITGGVLLLPRCLCLQGCCENQKSTWSFWMEIAHVLTSPRLQLSALLFLNLVFMFHCVCMWGGVKGGEGREP